MSWRATVGAVAVMVAAAAVLFWLFQRQIGGGAPAFYLPPEVLRGLESSLEDQKRLAELDPEREESYRRRFEELETTVGRLRIVEQSRERLIARYELLLLASLAASVVLATGWYAVRHSRYAPRLARLRGALAELARGRRAIRIGDRGGDTLGRIARMVEEASRTIDRDRRRLRSLQNLSRWQEAARRHAHEMRTPLTGARLSLERMRRLTAPGLARPTAELSEAIDSLAQELDRLAQFAERFAAFARLAPPRLARNDVSDLVRRFAAAYGEAWPGVEVRWEGSPAAAAEVDPELMRQVFANLCENSARAMGERGGTLRLTVETRSEEVRVTVADDGPGVPPEIRERLFEPYATGGAGGWGLGLAISKKILLDHGGDLELVDSSPGGAVFVLSLPRPAAP